MAGNTKETAVWSGADVYKGAEGTAGPTDTATVWAVGWNLVGLLDGEAGFVHGREDETKEHYAWGGLLFKRTKSKHKRTVKFTALEDNDVVFGLVNPGSTRTTATGTRTNTIKVPTTERFALGMEVREGDRIRRRYTPGHAEVQSVAEIKESENEPTVYEITALIFPTSDGDLWVEVEDDPNV